MATDPLKSSVGLLRWPHLVTPRESDTGGEPRYSATFVVSTSLGMKPKDKEFLKDISKMMDNTCFQKWNIGVQDMQRRCLDTKKKFSVALKRNDEEKRAKHAGIGVAPDGFHFEAKSKFPIDCFDQYGAKLNAPGKPITQEVADLMFFDGAIAYVWVSCYTYDHPSGGLGLGLNLNGIQFVRDSVRLGGGSIEVDAVDQDDVPEGYGAAPDPVVITPKEGPVTLKEPEPESKPVTVGGFTF